MQFVFLFIKKNKVSLRFILIFLSSYCLVYYGSLFLIGAADPRGAVYWPTFTKLFNVFGWLTELIVQGALGLMQLIGHEAERTSFNSIRYRHAGVGIASVCLGYAVMSFWLAFITANRMRLLPRIIWMTGGLCVIVAINIVRIVLIVLGIYYRWFNPAEVSHDQYHSMFNTVAYGFVFLLMWMFIRWDKQNGINHS